jgi:TolB-like protein
MSFIKELMRRNVFRVVLTYAVAGWLLVEGMDLLTETFEAPPWVMKVFIGAVLLGILPVAIFSWVYEVTPEGIKKEATDHPAHAPGSGRKLDIAVIVMLAVAIGLVVADKLSRDVPVSPAPAEEEVTAREGPPMLAVLPFVSASLGGDSEFFASGVHDDLLTQLAQLQSIRVISRTSVLEYRNTVSNIREIGKELGADAILEGGVQSAGKQIRINAQLIDARTDEHLWAQTYDRELSTANIFDMQTEIARAITSALQATLTVQDATQLTVLPTENMAAYRAYHRAMEIRDSGVHFDNTAFRQALEEAVALDPTFTRAWAELAGILSLENFSEEDPEFIQRAEQVLEQIRTLAPKSADYLIAQAFYTYYVLKNYDRAQQLITQAQDMLPSDVRVVELKSWIQRRQGDFEGMAESQRLAHTLDPRNPRWTQGLATTLVLSHRYEDATREIENSTFQDYGLSTLHNILQLREHRDFGRWVEAQAALDKEFESDAFPQYLWDARIANREFGAAEKLLGAMQEPGETDNDKSGILSIKEWNQIITNWFMQRSNRLAELLTQARTDFDKDRDSDGNSPHYSVYLDIALVTAAEGNTEETERLIRRWRRGAAEDLAELVNIRHYACQVLGIAKATTAAVECIRTGLAEPSFVMPFLEPFLPYYDSMRDEPVFVDLLADLADAANNP